MKSTIYVIYVKLNWKIFENSRSFIGLLTMLEKVKYMAMKFMKFMKF